MNDTDFGRDISCTDSIRTGRFATNLQLVGEACYRRLTTPRGMLRGGDDEAEYGLDLTELIGASNPDAIVVSLPARIRSELTKDPRVDAVAVDVVHVRSGASSAFTIAIDVTTGLGPFTLQILATEVTTELLGIT